MRIHRDEEFVDSDLKYDKNKNGAHSWVCVNFIYHDSENGTEKFLWVKDNESLAGLGGSCHVRDSSVGYELNGKMIIVGLSSDNDVCS